MRPGARTKLVVYVCLLGIPAAWIISEVRWDRVNDPGGKFSTVSGYLAVGRLPREVSKSYKDGHTYFIALGPLDSWLAVPSGPAGYAFDETGRMVDWSFDTGDDPEFLKRWPLSGTPSSIEELEQLARKSDPKSRATMPAGS